MQRRRAEQMTKIYQQIPDIKFSIVKNALMALKPATAIDQNPFETREALRNALGIIIKYPELEEIKKFPLCRPTEEQKIMWVEKHLCLCLSGYGPQGTIEMILDNLLVALDIIENRLNEFQY